MFNFRTLHSKDPYTQDTSPSPQQTLASLSNDDGHGNENGKKKQ